VRPLNALVRVAQPSTDITIAPGSQQRVQVPIDVVGTGTVLMVAQLHTPDGVALGQPQIMRVTAQPTIETAVAVALGIAIVLLIAFGIWRSVRKRRRGEARGDADDIGDREARDRPVKETA
jgi:membrane protein implicated in regulation of membrane protease activity